MPNLFLKLQNFFYSKRSQYDYKPLPCSEKLCLSKDEAIWNDRSTRVDELGRGMSGTFTAVESDCSSLDQRKKDLLVTILKHEKLNHDVVEAFNTYFNQGGAFSAYTFEVLESVWEKSKKCNVYAKQLSDILKKNSAL